MHEMPSAAPRGVISLAPRRPSPRTAQSVFLIIAAKGPHFTVGLDLKEFGGNFASGGVSSSKVDSNQRMYESIRTMQYALTAIAELEIPVIAAVHGYCIGGGVDLISACDIRLASGNAVFSIREAKVAIVADLGTLQRLPKIVSAGHYGRTRLQGQRYRRESRDVYWPRELRAR